MKFKQYDFRTAYIDLLLNVLTTILFILAIAFAMVTVKKNSEEAGIKPNAQYMVTMEWFSELDCDVDIWVKDSLDNLVFYKQQTAGLMNIERDDLGKLGDVIYNVDGSPAITVTENKETWALRGKLPGEYTFNVHLYGCKIGDQDAAPIGYPVKVDVRFEFIKINPSLVVLRTQQVTLTQVWEEKNVFVANILESGAVAFDVIPSRALVNIKKEITSW